MCRQAAGGRHYFFKNYRCLIETQLFAFCYRQTVLNWGSFNVYWNSAGKEGFIHSSCYVWIFWQLDTCCITKVIRIDIIPENLAWGELHLRRVNCTSPGYWYVASNPWKQAGGRSFHRENTNFPRQPPPQYRGSSCDTAHDVGGRRHLGIQIHDINISNALCLAAHPPISRQLVSYCRIKSHS